MEDQLVKPEQITPFIQILGVWGTIAIAALFAGYKLGKQWIDSRGEDDKQIDHVIDLVADSEDQNAKRDKALGARVDSLTDELDTLKHQVEQLIEDLERDAVK